MSTSTSLTYPSNDEANPTTLSNDITSSATTIGVGDIVSTPSTPYLALLAQTNGKREIVEVTSEDTSNNNITVNRGSQGTSAKSFNSGDKVFFGVQPASALDKVNLWTDDGDGSISYSGDVDITSGKFGVDAGSSARPAIDINGSDANGTSININNSNESATGVILLNDNQLLLKTEALNDPIQYQASEHLFSDGDMRVGDNNSPNYKLDVQGDINFTGNLRENGNSIETTVDIARYSTSDDSTDINKSTKTTILVNEVEREDTSFDLNTSNGVITIQEDGVYEISAHIAFTSTDARVNPKLWILKNDTDFVSGASLSGYIRAGNSNHNASSTNLETILDLKSGDDIRFETEANGESGTVNLLDNDCVFTFKEIAASTK